MQTNGNVKIIKKRTLHNKMSQDKYHYQKPTGPIIQADKKGRLAVVLSRCILAHVQGRFPSKFCVKNICIP